MPRYLSLGDKKETNVKGFMMKKKKQRSKAQDPQLDFKYWL